MIFVDEIKMDGVVVAHVSASTAAKLETGECLWDWRVYQEPHRLIGGTELRHNPDGTKKGGGPTTLLLKILTAWQEKGGQG